MGADFYDDAFLQQMFTSCASMGYAFGWGGQEICPSHLVLTVWFLLQTWVTLGCHEL